MARHDVYKSPKSEGLILDVQNDIPHMIALRVFAPLMPADKDQRVAARLNTEFEIGDGHYVMVPQLIAAVPAAALGAPVASLKQHHHAITEALDMLF